MARSLRLEFAGALYHVTARGHERRSLLYGDEDQELLRQKLAASVGRYQVEEKVEYMRRYRWSSYSGYAGLDPGPVSGDTTAGGVGGLEGASSGQEIWDQGWFSNQSRN